MSVGTAKWFNESKGYGSIAPSDGSDDIIVHFSVINATRFRTLGEGQAVKFDVERGPKGLQARNVSLFEACSAFTARYGLHARRVPQGPSTLQASAASLPPRPFQLLPAGATVAGWDSHPPRERAFHGALRNDG